MESNIEKYIRTNNIVLYAMVAGGAFFALLSLYIAGSATVFFDLGNNPNPEIFVVFLVSLLIVVIGSFSYRNGLFSVLDLQLVEAKLETYRRLFIKKLAFAEMAMLIPLLVFLLTGHKMFLVIAGLFVGYLLNLRLNKERLINALKLTPDDMAHFETPAV